LAFLLDWSSIVVGWGPASLLFHATVAVDRSATSSIPVLTTSVLVLNMLRLVRKLLLHNRLRRHDGLGDDSGTPLSLEVSLVIMRAPVVLEPVDEHLEGCLVLLMEVEALGPDFDELF